MSSAILKDAWAEIAASGQGEGPYLHLQLRGGSVPIGAILRASDKRPGLLVRFPLSEWPQLPRPVSGRGLLFEKPVMIGRESMGLPILVAHPDLIELFAQMGADLVAQVESTPVRQSAALRVLRRIDLWRRFMQKNSGPLSAEECRGLFAELHVLDLVATREGAQAAVEAWKGPEGQLQDFNFGDGLLEVKSWQLGGSASVRISQPSQIIVDPLNPMHLVAVQLSTPIKDGYSLPEQVQKLRARLGGPEAERFENLLALAGYSDVHAEQYTHRMMVVDLETYEVVEGFPHIDARHLPGGVSDVKYSINLGALSPFRTGNPHLYSR